MTQLSYIVERDIPGLAQLLRGFDESAYRLELNGEVMSRSSWDVAGFDGFDLRWPRTLDVKVLQGDDGAISSPAAQPGAAECSVTSVLYVKEGEKIYQLSCCFTQDTISGLFEKVLEKIQTNDPSESREFLLRIGRTDYALDEESKTTTLLGLAGCAKDLTIHVIFCTPLKPEEEVQVEFVPL